MSDDRRLVERAACRRLAGHSTGRCVMNPRTIILPCPVCPAEIEVSEVDPDGSLSDLWDHLGAHRDAESTREQLFVRAQKNARESS